MTNNFKGCLPADLNRAKKGTSGQNLQNNQTFKNRPKSFECTFLNLGSSRLKRYKVENLEIKLN